MNIVIDTNALHRDYLLRRAALVSLAAARERAGCRLCVPEVAVAEHVKHFRDARRTAASQLRQAARDVEQLFGHHVPVPDPEAAPDDAEAVVRERLAALGIAVLPTPATPHAEVMARAVSRRPPFSPDGRGYQDTLIWLSIVELVRAGDPVILVSGDKAFGDGALAAELADEAGQFGNGVVVHLARTLSDALEAHVQPRLERLSHLEEALARGTSRLDLKAWLSENLAPMLRDHESREAEEKDASLAFEWASIENPAFEIVQARALNEREAYVRLRVKAEGHVGGWQWMMSGPDDVDRDWVEDDVEAEVDLELLVSDEATVTSHTVLAVSPSGILEPREPDFEDDD